jgi:K+-transporting ATPase ATPase C chain
MKDLRPCLTLFLLLFLLTGLFYPLSVLGLGQILFPQQANGSLIEQNGAIIGSSLIAQNFTGDEWFHPRPSYAGTGNGYDAANSSGSNLAPSAPELAEALRNRVAALRVGGIAAAIPVDLVTASGSGLDPDISQADARFQASRVAAARHLDIAQVEGLIDRIAQPPMLGILGETRVNVLALNLALAGLAPQQP